MKKKEAAKERGRLWRRGLAGLSFLCLFYFFCLLWYLGAGNWFLSIWLAGSLALGALSAAWPRLAALPRPVRRTLGALVLLVLAVFLGLEGLIVSAARDDAAPGAEYVIILGARVNGQRPSLALQQRIDTACTYLLANPAAYAVASGGQGEEEEISEARAIAAGLVEQGVAPERILLEEQSTSTEENLRFTRELLGGEAKDREIVIVTSEFHLFRAKALARRLGYGRVGGLAASTSPGLLPHYYVREFCAVVSTWLLGWSG